MLKKFAEELKKEFKLLESYATTEIHNRIDKFLDKFLSKFLAKKVCKSAATDGANCSKTIRTHYVIKNNKAVATQFICDYHAGSFGV